MQAGGTPSVDDALMWDEEGLPWVAIADMTKEATVVRTDRRVSQAGIVAKNLPVGSPGTLLFAMYASVGAVGVLGTEGSWNQAILGIEPRPGLADSRFARYWLEHLKPDLAALTRSNTQDNLNAEQVGNLPFPTLGVTSQRVIADYLDRETARIDALIAAKRRMVELLEERRISAAHAAITGEQVRGPRQPGSSWLGTVPRHWRMVRIGSMFEVQLGRMLNGERSQGPDLRPYLRNINIRWDSVNTAELAEMDFPPLARMRYRVQVGDLLVNEGGAGIGRSAIWDGGIDEVYYQKSVHRVRSRGHLSVRWLLEWLRIAVDRRVFEIEGNLATIPHVPAEALRRFRVPCPPELEAESCLGEMEKKVDRDKAMQCATESQINLLQERRQSLITAAVAGHLDIPEAA
jgi:type I restriction enzyme S subunit